ncbi:hypothetical protein NQZ68_014752 [Dissostichus eleginoides]|nr:hypothetical protein NQZ68_014752 [Dissostichus eleginoides]
MCGWMGETLSAAESALISLKRHCEAAREYHNHRGAGDNRNNAISNHWKSKCFHHERSLFVPCDTMGLEKDYIIVWEREALDCHLVSVSLTAPSCEVKQQR